MNDQTALVGTSVAGADGHSKLGRLDQKTIGISLVDILRVAILDGRFPPGTQLREMSIAAELGVSRAPLREALTVLSELGLVSRVPFRGSFVATVNPKHISEIASLRKRLEPWAIELALSHLSEHGFAGLTTDVKTMQRAADEGDMASSIDAHMSFHRRLYEGSGNDMLTAIWKSWEAQLQLFLSLDHRAFDDLHELASAHSRLLDAISTQDINIIRNEVELHIHGADPTAEAGQDLS